MCKNITVNIGSKIGLWNVLSEPDGGYALCRCDCGTERLVNVKNLQSGTTKSCGCVGTKRIQLLRVRDIQGQRFGKLVAMSPEYHVTSGGNKIKYWKCQCDCGRFASASTHDLLSGHTKSCGKCIYNISPKVLNKRIYNAWMMMIARCENPKAQAYHNYGERGIKVCEEWHDFNAFLNWALSNGYEDCLSIDRIDVNGNYCPQNCRWVTDKVQGNNRRTNHYVSYKGETHTVKEWSELMGISYNALISRINKGWTIEDAFERPVRRTTRKAC